MFKKYKIANKKAFVAMLFFIVAYFSHATIVLIASDKGFDVKYDSSNLLLLAIALSLFSMSLGYDGRKHKKWVVVFQAMIGALYVFEVVAMLVQLNESFWEKWTNISWANINWYALTLLAILPFFLTALAGRQKARPTQEPPANEQSVAGTPGK